MAETLFVFGGESTALEIAEVACRYHSERWKTFLVVPNGAPRNTEHTIHEDDLPSKVKESTSPPRFIISMWKAQYREHWLSAAREFDLVPQTVVHPLAFISSTASVGEGVYVAAQSSVSCNAVVHDHVIVNFNVTVGHDSVIGSHSFLNPGARVSANAMIGQHVLIGANAFIFQGKQVGDNTLIDALTYIDRDVPANSICSSKRLEVHKRVF